MAEKRREERKEELRARIMEGLRLERTGIDGLDEALNGGIANGSVVLLLGEPGSFNSTFAQQVCYNHASAGGKVAYYTIETIGVDIINSMSAHNWSLENLMKDGLWEFICVQTPELHDILQAVTPVNQHCVIISHSANPFNALNRDVLEKVKAGCWTVFDSLSYLLLEFSSKDIFNLVIYLSTIAMVYGGVHFIILHEGVHDEKWLNALSLISDGVMCFKISETGRGVEGMIRIRKMSKIYRSRSVPFTINERGFVIETTVRIA